MVKWTSPNTCLVLSESISKLHTSFEFYEEKSHRHFKKFNDLQSQATYDDRTNFKKSLHNLEDGASDVQVGDIGKVICLNFD